MAVRPFSNEPRCRFHERSERASHARGDPKSPQRAGPRVRSGDRRQAQPDIRQDPVGQSRAAFRGRRRAPESRHRARRAGHAGRAGGVRIVEERRGGGTRRALVPHRRNHPQAQTGVQCLDGSGGRQELGRSRGRHLRGDRLPGVLRPPGAAYGRSRTGRAASRRTRSARATSRWAWARSSRPGISLWRSCAA